MNIDEKIDHFDGQMPLDGDFAEAFGKSSNAFAEDWGEGMLGILKLVRVVLWDFGAGDRSLALGGVGTKRCYPSWCQSWEDHILLSEKYVSTACRSVPAQPKVSIPPLIRMSDQSPSRWD